MKKVFFILICIALLLTGCAEEELCGTPLAPAMCEFDGYGALHELANLIADDEELSAYLEEKGYADTGITEREQVDRCISLVERAAVPKVEGEEPTLITVYPDDDWMQVDYYFGRRIMFRYFLKDTPDNGPVAEEVGFKLEENTEYINSSQMFFTGEIGGIPAEVMIPEMETKEAEDFFDALEFFTIPELRDKYAAQEDSGEEIYDPGPPTLWQFYNIDDYFAMEEALNLSDEELEAYADEHGLWEVPGFSSVRDSAERVREMMHDVGVPQTDGCAISYMDVNAEEGRTSVFFDLMGTSSIHVLYSFDAEWEKERIASLGKNGEEQIGNPNTEKLCFTEHDENMNGLQIYRFGAVVNGKYVSIFVFGGTYEAAKEAVSKMSFKNIGQLQNEDPEACEVDTVRFDSLGQFQDYLVTTTMGSDIADLGSLESYWLPEDIPENYVIYKITAGIVDIGFWYLPRDIVEQGETFGAEARGKHYLFISPRNNSNGRSGIMGMYLPKDAETGEQKLLGESAINAYEVSVER